MRTDFRSLIKAWQRAKYFTGNFVRYYMPDAPFLALFHFRERAVRNEARKDIEKRIAYYTRLKPGSKIDTKTAVRIGDFRFPWKEKKRHTTYFFDLFTYVRCFPKNLLFNYVAGDVNWNFPSPTFAKTRPVTDGFSNTVILPLNKVRHFRFIKDSLNFREKKDMIVFRNVVRRQPWRTRFLEKFIDHPMCDAGQINTDTDRPEFVKPYIPMQQQLDYKFIASIEGHDVATNLKWVMSSNSIAVMPRPRIESWFMEGTLIPDYHYIEVKPDYSDLIEKLEHYIAHPDEAEDIIRHAHEYVDRFRNKKTETLIARMVTQRYFQQTGQLNPNDK